MIIRAGRKSLPNANIAATRSEILSQFQKNRNLVLLAVIQVPRVQVFPEVFHQGQAIQAAHQEAVLEEDHPEEVAQAEAGNYKK